MKSITKSLLLLSLVACVCGSASGALTQLSFSPNPADLGDLDHHLVYTWRIDNINLTNVSVTGATLTFSNMRNWDSNPNMLFAWLLDTSIGSGVSTTQDVDPNQVPVVDIADAFLGSLPTLITSTTKKTKLFEKSFTTTGTTYTYSFNAAQLTALTSYINSGHDIAFGFDPDCHFFNDGITFTMNVTPVPEAASLIPVAILVAGATMLEVRRRRNSTM